MRAASDHIQKEIQKKLVLSLKYYGTEQGKHYENHLFIKFK